MLHDIWPRADVRTSVVGEEKVLVARRRAMSRRLPAFTVCWLVTTAPWYVLLAGDGLLPAARALLALFAGCALLAVTGAVCRRKPTSARVGFLIGCACIALAGISAAFITHAGGSAEALAFSLLTLYLGAALFFTWGWLAELVIVIPTVALWAWTARALTFRMPGEEIAAAIVVGSAVSILIAEGAARSFRLAFLHQEAEKKTRRALEIARDEAERARHEAEAATRAKDEFLATVSHELRSPISAILSWTQTLLRRPDDAGLTGRALCVIEANAHAQARLIEDLLDVSRIVSGKLHLELRRLDLRAVARTTVETMRPRAAVARVALTLEIEKAPVSVVGDLTRLQQVLGNLLANSLKFTPAGGCVTVRVGMQEASAEMRIDDNGVGIPPDRIEHIFDRFEQASTATPRRHGGLGLGLSIARDIVAMHGGTIEASSAGPGCGASFQVRLPLATSEGAQILTTARYGESDTSGKRVSTPRKSAGCTDDEDSREQRFWSTCRAK